MSDETPFHGWNKHHYYTQYVINMLLPDSNSQPGLPRDISRLTDHRSLCNRDTSRQPCSQPLTRLASGRPASKRAAGCESGSNTYTISVGSGAWYSGMDISTTVASWFKVTNVGTVTFFSNRYLRHIIYIIGKSKKYTFQRYLMFIVISFVASTTLFQRCNTK